VWEMVASGSAAAPSERDDPLSDTSSPSPGPLALASDEPPALSLQMAQPESVSPLLPPGRLETGVAAGTTPPPSPARPDGFFPIQRPSATELAEGFPGAPFEHPDAPHPKYTMVSQPRFAIRLPSQGDSRPSGPLDHEGSDEGDETVNRSGTSDELDGLSRPGNVQSLPPAGGASSPAGPPQLSPDRIPIYPAASAR
jgi:hypothetical protein